jgi:hypothetical protein
VAASDSRTKLSALRKKSNREVGVLGFHWLGVRTLYFDTFVTGQPYRRNRLDADSATGRTLQRTDMKALAAKMAQKAF